jgi:hypothetical protein
MKTAASTKFSYNFSSRQKKHKNIIIRIEERELRGPFYQNVLVQVQDLNAVKNN